MAEVHETDPDAQLMLALGAGDGSALEALFARWAAPLLRYLERIVHDAATAEELVQETFIRVHGARERYRADARFSTWLYRIATNLALNELRRPRRARPHQSTDAPGGPDLVQDAEGSSAEAQLDARRMGARVADEMERLPERQRVALWLCAVEGRAYADVADVLDTSESAVKSLVHRARATLAERLGSARPDGATPQEGRKTG